MNDLEKSNISWTFLIHLSQRFKLDDVYNGMILSPSTIHIKKNELNRKKYFFFNVFLQIHTHENVLVLKSTNKVD
jgi:hypothetical protein